MTTKRLIHNRNTFYHLKIYSLLSLSVYLMGRIVVRNWVPR